jgi:hypothetical protein
MKVPGIFHIRSVQLYAYNNPTTGLARMTGQPFFLKRFKAAWLVFTGRADALIWS